MARLLRNNEEGEVSVQDNTFGFNHVVRGYSPEEVNDYINNLSDSYKNTQTVLNKQREEFEAEKEMLLCEIGEMKESRDELQQQSDEMKVTIEQLRDEILALASGTGNSDSDEEAAKEIKRLIEENSKLSASVERAKDEIKALSEEKDKLAAMKSGNKDNDEAMKEALQKQKALESKIASLDSDKRQLERELRDANNKLTNAAAGGDNDEELEVLRVENNDLVEKNRNLNIEMARIQKKSKSALEEVEKFAAVKEAFQENIDALSAEKDKLNRDLTKAVSEIEEVKAELKAVQKEKEKASQNTQAVKETLAGIIEGIKELEQTL